MRAAALILLFASPAHADLYRWIDPDTGSVKLSSLPPSDPRVAAEVVRYRGTAAPPKPAPEARVSIPALEGRWRSLLAQLAGLTPQDFTRGAEGIRQHVEAYEAVRAELDRRDPAGAARRSSESATLLERMRQGLASR